MDELSRRDFLAVSLATGIGIACAHAVPVMAQKESVQTQGGAEDIYSILRKDHKEVSELIQKMQRSAPQQKDVQTLRKMILPHAKAEETVFYPVLQGSEQKNMLKGVEEHKAVENLLNEMKNAQGSQEQLAAQLDVLKDMIQHHVKEEEGIIFSASKKKINSNQAKELGSKFQAKKQELMNSMT